MGYMPINRLLLSMSLPMMISMLVQALYNVVDSVFVSYISEDALAAVGLAFPAQNLMIAVATGTGVGINALLSKSLGEKNFDTANRTAVNGIFLAFCSWVVFAVLGGLFSRTFMELQSDVPAIVDYGTTYLSIVTVVSCGIMFQVCFERLLQSTGRTTLAMITQLTGAVINIIMDPILIFGYFGFPRMEVAGAALATVLGQIIAAALAVFMNFKYNPEVHIRLREIRWNRQVAGEIYRVGFPSIVMQSIGSVMVFGMNKILITFTETAVNVFGVYYKLQSFVFMPVFGVTNALVPIVGYNYGARKKQRITDAVRVATVMALAIMAAGTLVFELGAGPLLGLFNASPAMHAMGEPAFRIIALSFLPAAVGIVMSSVFQALGEGLISLVMSATRQLVFLLPLAFLLAKFSGLAAVWASIPLAEVVGFALALLFYRHIYNHKIAHIETVQFD